MSWSTASLLSPKSREGTAHSLLSLGGHDRGLHFPTCSVWPNSTPAGPERHGACTFLGSLQTEGRPSEDIRTLYFLVTAVNSKPLTGPHGTAAGPGSTWGHLQDGREALAQRERMGGLPPRHTCACTKDPVTTWVSGDAPSVSSPRKTRAPSPLSRATCGSETIQHPGGFAHSLLE